MIVYHSDKKGFIHDVFEGTIADDIDNAFLSHLGRHASENDLLWLIENGKLKPSKQLADSLCSMLKGNQEFVLLDDQKVVYETALHMARTSQRGQKQVLIVEGGPGTGKSVIAINLLVELTKEGIATQYVSKNAAPREVYTEKLIGNFKKSYIKDIGSKSSIQQYAEECGATVHIEKLSSQFRCNGSDGYLSWLDNTLQIKETANIRLTSEDFDFKVFDDPNKLFETIKIKNINQNKSRLVAGYCWDWASKKDDTQYDIIKNTYRTLMTRGMKGCYVYCCDKALADYLSSQIEIRPTTKQETLQRIESEVNDEVKFIDFLPLYSVKAACGNFGDGDIIEESGWMRVEGLGKLNRNMFVVQASGHSMNPLINDGDYCVFRANPAGSRQGKVVLVEHRNFYDPEYSGSYSIKTYTSKKKYDPIVIREEESDDFRIIGEFLGNNVKSRPVE